MTPLILVIDDDDDIRQGVSLVLTQAGFTVVSEADGRAGLRRLFVDKPDLVLLDVIMPDMDGWQTIDRIRDMSEVPVLMLTARGTETDRVRGLSAGADDYLVKPFSGQELVARVRSLLRRSSNRAQDVDTIERGSVVINIPLRQVFVAGAAVELTALEFRVLRVLMKHARQVFSEEQLLKSAWNDPSDLGTDRVKYVIHRLRQKLQAGGISGQVIQAARGVGYRYWDE